MEVSLMLRVLDLFSGLGGFSEAFVRAGDEVLRVENNPLLSEVPHTTMQDVQEMRARLALYHAQGEPIREYDILLAAPPCREFSLAYSAPRSVAQRNGEEFEPSMDLLEATLDIIRITKPRYWVIENVVGSIKYFKEFGLEPRQIHGAHVLYGNFPLFQCGKLPTKASKDKTSSDPLRANHTALIPLELSMQLRRACLDQKTLYCDY
ncbi:MAG: DNA cytosine methyltransferase [Candidatus Bathyarchaeota archaeon]|nr:DNA cytosine methyltransferase [Candidatus Bathyarchaeota archaeon]